MDKGKGKEGTNPQCRSRPTAQNAKASKKAEKLSRITQIHLDNQKEIGLDPSSSVMVVNDTLVVDVLHGKRQYVTEVLNNDDDRARSRRSRLDKFEEGEPSYPKLSLQAAHKPGSIKSREKQI